MDTSTSNPTTPFQFVCGKKIRQRELTHDDWNKLICELLEGLRPRLKYISGLKTLREHMNRELPLLGDMRISTAEEVLNASVDPSTGLNEKSRYVRVCSIPCNSTILKGLSLKHPDYLHDHTLVITEAGRLFIFYTLCSQSGLVLVTKSIQIFCFEDLMGKFKYSDACEEQGDIQTKTLGALIFGGLLDLLRITILRKEDLLKGLKRVYQYAAEKALRIEGFETVGRE